MECFIQCLLEFVNLIIENQHKKKFLHISVKLNKVKRDYFNVLKGYVKVLLIKKVIALGFCLANVMELCRNWCNCRKPLYYHRRMAVSGGSYSYCYRIFEVLYFTTKNATALTTFCGLQKAKLKKKIFHHKKSFIYVYNILNLLSIVWAIVLTKDI